MPEQPSPQLLALTTAVPPYRLDQGDVAGLARRLFARANGTIERLLPAFVNAGIETRYSCVPLDWYLTPLDWKERNRLYLENALDLLEDAALRCLKEAGIEAGAVDTVVTVSTSGIATPSLDARLIDRLGLRRDVERLPVFGLGCAGGALGLGRAAALARGAPGSRVLLLVVELCGLTFRANDLSKSNIIATALFGDGAAAALIGCAPEGSGPAIRASGEYTWPDSLDVMGWRVESDGLGVLFSRDIPAIIEAQLGPAVDAFLARQGLSRAALAGVLCHPGGAKVLDALEALFAFEPGGMTVARRVLRDYGNMSAVTLLFVLEAALSEAGRGPHLASSLGPGFSAGFLLLELP